MTTTPADTPPIPRQTTSAWQTAPLPRYAPLTADADADVCVVGAGIAGLTTAYLLARAGRRVIVLDAGEVGNGETGRTTAHLASAIDDRFKEILRIHGRERAALAYQSHAAAIDRIESIVRDEQIDCDFERLDGYLFLAPEHTQKLLEEELAAAHEVGCAGAHRVSRAPLPGFDTGPSLRFPAQGQFHPRKYLAGLLRALARDGATVHEHTRVTSVRGGDDPQVETAGGQRVRARAIVVATNTPIHQKIGVHVKQGPYTSYVVALRVPAGLVPRGLYWDTADPYHYVRVQPDGEGELLIVGGEDHKTGQATDGERRLAALEAWTRERFPGAEELAYRWSGMVFEPVDGLAYIGRFASDEEHVYTATGDSGMGMTHATIAGMILCDAILGQPNPWAELYDPGRAPIKATGELLRENLNVAAQYTDWLTAGEVEDAAQIPAGAGAIVRRGVHKLAVYRDAQGELHACSAACPHAFGVVTWNPLESTWDCPCHGSLFDPYGRVIHGPSTADLPRTTLDEPR